METRIYTERYGTVRIEETFTTKEEAFANGYTEYTGTKEVRGKSTGTNKMVFAKIG